MKFRYTFYANSINIGELVLDRMLPEDELEAYLLAFDEKYNTVVTYDLEISETVVSYSDMLDDMIKNIKENGVTL